MTPLARRLTAKLQAARRPLTGDRQLEDEPPDDTVRMTRLPAAAENVCHSSAAHRDLEENKKEMRRAVCDTKPRTTALMNKMTAEHNSLQAQEYDAAARPLQTGQRAAEGGEQKCETVTERLRAALQHSGVGEVLTQAVEQQSEDSRASEGRDAAQEFPFDGDSCQPEQGTAVSVVQERGVGVGVEYTTAQESGSEGSRASEGRDAAQEKAQLEADEARAGIRNSVCEKCESEQGTAVSNDSSDEAAERPRAALQHNRKQMQPEQAAEDGSVADEAAAVLAAAEKEVVRVYDG